MSTIFGKIISGEIPSHKVAENDQFLAFLDVRPLAKGHTLVIPKKPVDYLFDIDDETYSGLFLFARQVAIALKKAVPCTKVGMAVVGLEVPHAHIHLVPMDHIGDLNFMNERKVFSQEEYRQIAAEISARL